MTRRCTNGGPDKEVCVKRCQQLREAQGRSKNAVAKDARLTPSCLSTIESGRWHPYDVQLARLAESLGFFGDPSTLLEEVDE